MSITSNPLSNLLSEQALQEFFRKADLVGHNSQQLREGDEIKTYFQLDDFEDGRERFSNATDAQRLQRLETFFSPGHRSRAKLGQGKHDRGEAVSFANGTVSEQDAKGIGRHFPLCAQGISVLHKVVAKGETWDVTVPQDAWNLGEMEELYSLVNVGTLVLEEGAKIVIRGNVFSLLCQNLICKGIGSSIADYQIGILPTPFSVDFGHGPQHGTRGSHGANGFDGSDGVEGELRSSILGAWVPDQAADRLHATDATDGEHGKDGGRGRNGGMCKLAEIAIRKVTGHMNLFSQAGAGGDGGKGGNGGDGGNGGIGAPGLQGFNQQIPAGNSGHGGSAGHGGRGGHAGNGGLASNIYVNVPDDATSQVSMVSFDSVGGTGGMGGKAGRAGKGGEAVVMSDQGLNGSPGIDGMDGEPGIPGQRGRPRPAAILYLNDLPFNKT